MCCCWSCTCHSQINSLRFAL